MGKHFSDAGESSPLATGEHVRYRLTDTLIASERKKIEGRVGVVLRSYRRIGEKEWLAEVEWQPPTKRHKVHVPTVKPSDLLPAGEE